MTILLMNVPLSLRLIVNNYYEVYSDDTYFLTLQNYSTESVAMVPTPMTSVGALTWCW